MSFRVLQASASSRAAFSLRRGSTLAGRFDVAIIGGGHNGLVAVSSAVCPCHASPLWHVASRAAGSVFAESGKEGGGTGEETHPWRSSRDGGNYPGLVGPLTCARAEIRNVVCFALHGLLTFVATRTHTLSVTCCICALDVSVVALELGWAVWLQPLPLHHRCRFPLLSCLLCAQPVAASSDAGPAAEGEGTVRAQMYMCPSCPLPPPPPRRTYVETRAQAVFEGPCVAHASAWHWQEPHTLAEHAQDTARDCPVLCCRRTGVSKVRGIHDQDG